MNITRWRRARTTNATDSSFASKIATATQPSGAGVFDLGITDAVTGLASGGGEGWDAVQVLPFGTGDADDVVLMQIIAWNRLGGAGQDGKTTMWIPTRLASLICTLGTGTGVAGGPIIETELLADTITITAEPTQTADVTRTGTLTVYSPADNTAAWAKVPLLAPSLLEFIFDDSTGNPTGMNTLFRLLGGC